MAGAALCIRKSPVRVVLAGVGIDIVVTGSVGGVSEYNLVWKSLAVALLTITDVLGELDLREIKDGLPEPNNKIRVSFLHSGKLGPPVDLVNHGLRTTGQDLFGTL